MYRDGRRDGAGLRLRSLLAYCLWRLRSHARLGRASTTFHRVTCIVDPTDLHNESIIALVIQYGWPQARRSKACLHRRTWGVEQTLRSVLRIGEGNMSNNIIPRPYRDLMAEAVRECKIRHSRKARALEKPILEALIAYTRFLHGHGLIWDGVDANNADSRPLKVERLEAGLDYTYDMFGIRLWLVQGGAVSVHLCLSRRTGQIVTTDTIGSHSNRGLKAELNRHRKIAGSQEARALQKPILETVLAYSKFLEDQDLIWEYGVDPNNPDSRRPKVGMLVAFCDYPNDIVNTLLFRGLPGFW
jgi:hypothetical protein